MLTMALPTGRMLGVVRGILRAAGMPAPSAKEVGRRLRVPGKAVCALFVKDRDVPIYVEHGVADLGVVGRDVLAENPAQLYEPVDLGVGRCRMVVARLKDRPLPEPPLRIATKYGHVAAEYYSRRGIPVELIRLHGAVELAPVLNLADGIVDIVETGTTLRENGLVEEETLFESSARVVVNRASFRLRGAELRSALSRIAQEADRATRARAASEEAAGQRAQAGAPR